MLLEPGGWTLASRIDDVLPALPATSRATPRPRPTLRRGAGHRPHATVADAIAELRGLRRGLAGSLEPLGLRAAVAGTHPSACGSDVEVSPGARYQCDLRVDARASRGASRRSRCTCTSRCPTPARRARAATACACTCRCCSRCRPTRRSGRAATRGSPRRARRSSQAFPRVGIPRAFGGYARLRGGRRRCCCAAEAIPEPTFLWWDVRLQPRLGTVEVRIMDAQTRVEDTAALVALVQCARQARSAESGPGALGVVSARGPGREPLPRGPRRDRRGVRRRFPGAPTARGRAPCGRAGGVPPGRGRPGMPRGAGVSGGAGQSPAMPGSA